jgi:protein-disulfide isomerase
MPKKSGLPLFLLALVICLAAPALTSPAMSAPPLPADPRTARAVQDYLRQMQAEDSKARDQRVADRIDALASNPASPVLGNPRGDVTIIVFSDYACPYCKLAEPRLMALAAADKGVRLVMKEYPILTKASMIASRLALAAHRQGKYRAFHLALMRREGVLDEAGIFETARAVGVDVNRARRDMLAPEVSDEIIANFNLARGIRAFQTPTYIVGGHILTSDSAEIDFAREAAAARRRK